VTSDAVNNEPPVPTVDELHDAIYAYTQALAAHAIARDTLDLTRKDLVDLLHRAGLRGVTL
jgi:hypothetical protein